MVFDATVLASLDWEQTRQLKFVQYMCGILAGFEPLQRLYREVDFQDLSE